MMGLSSQRDNAVSCAPGDADAIQCERHESFDGEGESGVLEGKASLSSSHHARGHLGASVQSWQTPRWLFDQLNAEFNFFLDVAASRENALCQYFYVEEEDALTQPWAPYTCFCNPPYRRLYPWVQKAYDESRQGATVVMLLPSSTGSKWFQEIVQPHAEVRFLRGRLKFEGAKHPATFDSLLAVFWPWKVRAG